MSAQYQVKIAPSAPRQVESKARPKIELICVSYHGFQQCSMAALFSIVFTVAIVPLLFSICSFVPYHCSFSGTFSHPLCLSLPLSDSVSLYLSLSLFLSLYVSFGISLSLSISYSFYLPWLTIIVASISLSLLSCTTTFVCPWILRLIFPSLYFNFVIHCQLTPVSADLNLHILHRAISVLFYPTWIILHLFPYFKTFFSHSPGFF